MLCKESDTGLLRLLTTYEMISDASYTSKEGQAHTLTTPRAEPIALNSFLLNFTCLDRTYLNN